MQKNQKRNPSLHTIHINQLRLKDLSVKSETETPKETWRENLHEVLVLVMVLKGIRPNHGQQSKNLWKGKYKLYSIKIYRNSNVYNNNKRDDPIKSEQRT